jgi:uncharacterized membrane protein
MNFQYAYFATIVAVIVGLTYYQRKIKPDMMQEEVNKFTTSLAIIFIAQTILTYILFLLINAFTN